MKPIKRCSSLDRDLLCNGAPTLCSRVDPRQGEEGTEGTALHQIAHLRMVTELGAVGDPGVAVECKATKFSAWISDYYYNFVKETTPADWSLEVEAHLEYEFDRFILSGHIDCLAMSADGSEAIIFDLKTGYIPVDIAEENEQVFGYNCVLLMAYPDLNKITSYIIQPRNDPDEGDQRISGPLVIEGDTLSNCLPTMERRINASLDNAMELNSGSVQCKWCPAAIQCPALIKERELMRHTLTEEEVARITRQPEDTTLADWVIASKTLNRPIEDAVTLAKERVKANGSLVASDGATITAKVEAGSLSYPDMPKFYEAFKQVLSDEESIPACWKPSKTKIIDEIANKRGVKKTSKKDSVTAESIWTGHLASFCEQGERMKLVIQSA